MGYPDDDFAANAVRSDREHNQEFVRYVGFAAQHGEGEYSLRKFFGADSSVASCNLEDAGGTICRLRGLLLARGN
jgi:hypothetical protein